MSGFLSPLLLDNDRAGTLAICRAQVYAWQAIDRTTHAAGLGILSPSMKEELDDDVVVAVLRVDRCSLRDSSENVATSCGRWKCSCMAYGWKLSGWDDCESGELVWYGIVCLLLCETDV